MTLDAAALIRDLDALVAPGQVGGATITATQRPSAAPQVTAAPKGWEAGVKWREDGAMLVQTTAQLANVTHDQAAWQPMVEELGLQVPPGFVVRLVEAKYDPAAWHRDTEFVNDESGRSPGGRTKAPAVTRPVWRYRFAIEPDSGQMHAEDVAQIIAEVLRVRRKPKKPVDATLGPRALNVVYADPQAGKVALLGGTQQLIERVADCFGMLEDHIGDLKKVGRAPTTAAWWDGGDCIEGFQNVRSQAQTNDLTLTQQVRAHRRFTTYGTGQLARQFSQVDCFTCGSNHAANRDGKDILSTVADDWGIEVMSQVQDAYALNPDAFGHVRFGYPHEQRDTLMSTVGGLPIGLAHGHQFRSGDTKAVLDWWKGQTFGRQPVADARVLITGHFHHFAAREMGDGRLWVQAPTLDNGSDWFTRISGELSVPGLLVFSSTPTGWDDLRILRPNG
jgi:hypothetical protein